jgi:hypothetical protein
LKRCKKILTKAVTAITLTPPGRINLLIHRTICPPIMLIPDILEIMYLILVEHQPDGDGMDGGIAPAL